MRRIWASVLAAASTIRLSADNGPGAVRLPACTAAGSLRAAIDEDLLGVVGAAETVGIIVVIRDAETAVMAVARIAPLVDAVRTARVEAVMIGLVGVAAVFAIETAGQGGADCAPDHHARNRRTGAPAIATEGVAQHSADHRAADHTGRIDGLAAFPVEGIIAVGIGTRITMAPEVFPVHGRDRRRSGTIPV